MKRKNKKGKDKIESIFNIQDDVREEIIKKPQLKKFRVIEWVKMKGHNPFLFTRHKDNLVTEEEYNKIFKEVI